MAYVSVAEWRPEQVTEWLKGLDNSIVSYIHWFSNNEVNGQQLLNLSPDELTHLGVYKLGHQELILEAVQHLRNFHYELDRENLQLLSLKLSCAAHSLYSEIRDQAESSSVPTQIMADVANVIHYVKPLVSWLDRPPFAGQLQYSEYKTQLLSLSLEMATSAQRDRFADRPVAKIRTCSSKLAKLADSIIQDVADPMILQPATLDVATIKKKVGEDLDFFLVPSFHGIHQIGDMKLSSPAHQSGKIQQGDEIVQVNYQTVVGWSRKKVLALFEESPNDLLLTLKRRPRHVKMYGQIYMKPYRLPSRKRASPYSRWNDNLPSPRPELLTIPHFDIARTVNLSKKVENSQNLSLEPSGTSSSSDEEFGQPSDSQSPASMRLYLPKPRASIQRRFTLSGPPRPSAQSEQFWRELQLERSWRSNQNNSQMNNSSAQDVGSKEPDVDEMFHLRDKSASFGNSIASASSRSTTHVPFTTDRIGSVKFDLSKFDSYKNDSTANDKTFKEERDKAVGDMVLRAAASEAEIRHDSQSIRGTDLNPHASLSISELNKIKRDAFFNNMEVSNTHSESSRQKEADRVKRIVESFKSDVSKIDAPEIDLKSPGKVMELVENFEKKESVVVPFKNKPDFFQTEKPATFVKAKREKGRLDKSCSAPAYDTTEGEPFRTKADFLNEKKETDAAAAAKQVVNKHVTDQKSKFVFPAVGYVPEDEKFRDTEISEVDDQSPKPGQICEVKENISPEKNICTKNDDSAKNTNLKEKGILLEEKLVQQSNTLSGNVTENIGKRLILEPRSKPVEVESKTKNPIKEEASCGSGDASPSVVELECEQQKKPVPAQRKSKLQPKPNIPRGSVNPCPLPPKPRSKPLPSPSESFVSSLSDELPPEPPPRPESTFIKPLNTKKNPLEVYNKETEDSFTGSESFRETNSKPLHAKGAAPVISVSKPAVLELPPIPNESKTFSSGTLSPVRKLSKQGNTSSTGSSNFFHFTSSEKEKPKASPSTLESLKAILTLGRRAGNVNSPRSVRKKTAMLAKKRNVSVKEITTFENSGFLWYRNRKGSAVASWTKYFFILQGSNFYGFKTNESHKADLFIHLPGFTCTPAEEVKSKEYSFKIYHTGTVFYFAANSEEDLQQWLDTINLAISFQDDKFSPEIVTFSQTDSDVSDTEPETETCFPTSPKMKKVLGSSPIPKPARSHQNLTSEPKKNHESQKRFGSLKKLSSQKHSLNNYFSGSNDSPEIASLDRKYLRFLGQKNSPTPVPTSRFRSYRRMQPTTAIISKGKPKVSSENAEENLEGSNLQINNRDPPRLARKPLHSSNPSLVHSDMADYRITQERMAEFGRLRSQGGSSEFGRLMTLEQFLQNRQEENFRPNRPRPPEMSGFMTLEQFLLLQEEERQRANRLRDRPHVPYELNPEPSEFQEELGHRSIPQNKIRGYPATPSSSSSSNQCLEGRSKKPEPEKPQVAPRNKPCLSSSSGSLKSMHQASSIPHSSSNDDNESTKSFELSSDKNGARKSSTSKFPECSKSGECNHAGGNNTTPDYQGIEYPPTFEPETYTLQHMLKNRQKRDFEPKNK